MKTPRVCNHRIRFKHHMIQTLPSPFRKWHEIHSFWEKLWSLSGKSHQPPWWCSKAGNFQKFLKQKSHDFLGIQLNYFKPKVTQLYARGPNKDSKCCLHSNKYFLQPRTHGNSPIATGRSHLQEWVCGHLGWDTQAPACCKIGVWYLCASRVYTLIVPEKSKHSKMAERGKCFGIVKIAISLCHGQDLFCMLLDAVKLELYTR